METGPLLLSYFRTPAEALHLAWSRDGLRWAALNGNAPVLRATVGNRSIRDPFIRRGADGAFHLLSTDSWRSPNLIHARSPDLVHWEPQSLVPVMGSIPGTRNVWAPEFVFDADARDYIVFWSSVTEPPGQQRIWASRTPEFRRFSPPFVLFDPGYTVIDATLVHDGERWVMFYKDERGRNALDTENKAIRVATSAALAGPYAGGAELLTARLTEGPAVFRVQEHWLLLYDYFMEKKWGASISEDLKEWRPVEEGLSVPDGARHGTVFSITEVELERLLAAYASDDPL